MSTARLKNIYLCRFYCGYCIVIETTTKLLDCDIPFSYSENQYEFNVMSNKFMISYNTPHSEFGVLNNIYDITKTKMLK